VETAWREVPGRVSAGCGWACLADDGRRVAEGVWETAGGGAGSRLAFAARAGASGVRGGRPASRRPPRSRPRPHPGAPARRADPGFWPKTPRFTPRAGPRRAGRRRFPRSRAAVGAPSGEGGLPGA